MNPRLVLRQAALGDVLARIALPPDGSDDGIRASRVVQLPMRLPLLCGVEPYARLLARLRATALRPEAVRVLPYDWRRSIVDAARGLATVAERHLAAWRAKWATLPLEERRHLPEPSLILVCHSMGGLVGRWFAEVEGGRGVVRRVVTLGTPFAGSLNALRVLADGHYLPSGCWLGRCGTAGAASPVSTSSWPATRASPIRTDLQHPAGSHLLPQISTSLLTLLVTHLGRSNPSKVDHQLLRSTQRGLSDRL